MYVRPGEAGERRGGVRGRGGSRRKKSEKERKKTGSRASITEKHVKSIGVEAPNVKGAEPEEKKNGKPKSCDALTLCQGSNCAKERLQAKSLREGVD